MTKSKILNGILLTILLPTMAFAFGFITSTLIQDGTILGVDINSTDTGTWTFENLTVTGTASAGGAFDQGIKTRAEILLLTCPSNVKGACEVVNSDEGDKYNSQSNAAGDYRNSRTGKAP